MMIDVHMNTIESNKLKMIHSSAQLMELPDELLLIILKQLKNIDMLYSLFGLNTRLNQVICDRCFTNEINFIDATDSTSDRMEILIDRFCLEILPNIDHLITCLKVQSTFMERVLLSGDYSNLSRLDIFIPHTEPVIHINDESLFAQRLKHRIFTLSICGERETDFDRSLMETRGNLFNYIFKIFTHVSYLKFYQTSLDATTCVHFGEQPSMFSSTLVELHVNLYRFEDFLYLLDGRFDQLRRLVVFVFNLWRLQSIPISTELIVNLKEFSFISINETDAYDEWIVPTFRRMINLEKLSLSLQIHRRRRFIDGNTLTDNFLSSMPRLKDFVFDIRSIVPLYRGEIDLQSDEEVRSTLKDLTKHPVSVYVDHFPEEGNAHCHFYTHPLLSTEYEYLSNHFRGELLENVQYLQLLDEQRPFEHSFFMRIAQSFPAMKHLCVNNRMAQQEKEHDQLSNENQQCPVIRYRSLRKLILRNIHDDYLEEFLYETRTSFSNDLHLCCYEGQLKRVTNNFTREETKVNYSKVKTFDLWVERDYSLLI